AGGLSGTTAGGSDGSPRAGPPGARGVVVGEGASVTVAVAVTVDAGIAITSPGCWGTSGIETTAGGSDGGSKAGAPWTAPPTATAVAARPVALMTTLCLTCAASQPNAATATPFAPVTIRWSMARRSHHGSLAASARISSSAVS